MIRLEKRGAIAVVAQGICQIIADLRMPLATLVVRRATLRWYVGLLREIHKVSLEDEFTDDSEFVYQIGSSSCPPYEVVLEINGKNVKMEIDTGAAVSIISRKTQKDLFPVADIKRASLKLHSVACTAVGADGCAGQVWGVCWQPHPLYGWGQCPMSVGL